MTPIGDLAGERDLLPPRGGDFAFASPLPRGLRDLPEEDPDPERRLPDLPREPDLEADRARGGAMVFFWTPSEFTTKVPLRSALTQFLREILASKDCFRIHVRISLESA